MSNILNLRTWMQCKEATRNERNVQISTLSEYHRQLTQQGAKNISKVIGFAGNEDEVMRRFRK